MTDAPDEGKPRHRGTDPDVAPRSAWLASFLVHALVVVLAFFVVWTVSPGEQDVTPAIASFDDPGLAPISELASDEPVEFTSEPIELEPEPVEIEPEVTLAELLRDLDDAQEKVVVERTTTPIERESLMNERRFPEVRFAGTGASNAERIVYVVDASGSLRSTWPFLIEELKRSIGRLAPTQQFQVIFFLDDAAGTGRGYVRANHPTDDERAHRLIRATRENIRSIEAWFDTIGPRGKGDPLEAIRIAFQFKPDAVFFLARFTGIATDPDRDALLAELNELNPRVGAEGNRAVVINGIQFLDADPRGVLEAVGAEHGSRGGSGGLPAGGNAYKLLTREELNARRR